MGTQTEGNLRLMGKTQVTKRSFADAHSNLPHWILTDGLLAKMSGDELRVFCILLMHANYKTGKCFPSLATIAQEAGWTHKKGPDEGRVSKAIKKLGRRGVVSKTWVPAEKTAPRRGGYRGRNFYQVNTARPHQVPENPTEIGERMDLEIVQVQTEETPILNTRTDTDLGTVTTDQETDTQIGLVNTPPFDLVNNTRHNSKSNNEQTACRAPASSDDGVRGEVYNLILSAEVSPGDAKSILSKYTESGLVERDAVGRMHTLIRNIEFEEPKTSRGAYIRAGLASEEPYALKKGLKHQEQQEAATAQQDQYKQTQDELARMLQAAGFLVNETNDTLLATIALACIRGAKLNRQKAEQIIHDYKQAAENMQQAGFEQLTIDFVLAELLPREASDRENLKTIIGEHQDSEEDPFKLSRSILHGLRETVLVQ